MPSSNLFNPIDPGRGANVFDLLGEEADSWNNSLATDRRHADMDGLIWEASQNKFQNGQFYGPFTMHELDVKFGKGGWKAVRRRNMWQAGQGKHRNIDNCKKSGHNHAARLGRVLRLA